MRVILLHEYVRHVSRKLVVSGHSGLFSITWTCYRLPLPDCSCQLWFEKAGKLLRELHVRARRVNKILSVLNVILSAILIA